MPSPDHWSATALPFRARYLAASRTIHRGFVMRISPSITPHGLEQDTYIVLDDFGRIGRAWRGTDENAAYRETLIRDLLAGEFNHPIRIVAFNAAEGWCRDVSVDIANELRRRVVEYDGIPKSVVLFLEANRR